MAQMVGEHGGMQHTEGTSRVRTSDLALVRGKPWWRWWPRSCPPRDRFVAEVLANLADRERWWQRLDELLSVAGAVPGLAVILRWARRRRA